MPDEQAPRRRRPAPWFNKITPEVLAGAGPGKRNLSGVDVSEGHASPLPGDNLTQDVYARAGSSRRNNGS